VPGKARECVEIARAVQAAVEPGPMLGVKPAEDDGIVLCRGDQPRRQEVVRCVRHARDVGAAIRKQVR
jgi:hypothetical protein